MIVLMTETQTLLRDKLSGAVDRICDSASRPKPALVSQVASAAEAVSRSLSD